MKRSNDSNEQTAISRNGNPKILTEHLPQHFELPAADLAEK